MAGSAMTGAGLSQTTKYQKRDGYAGSNFNRPDLEKMMKPGSWDPATLLKSIKDSRKTPQRKKASDTGGPTPEVKPATPEDGEKAVKKARKFAENPFAKGWGR